MWGVILSWALLSCLHLLIPHVIYLRVAFSHQDVHTGNVLFTSDPWSFLSSNLPVNGNGKGHTGKHSYPVLSRNFPLRCPVQLWLARAVVCSNKIIHRHVKTATTPCDIKGCFLLKEDWICILLFDKHDTFLKAAGGWNHLVMFVPVIFLCWLHLLMFDSWEANETRAHGIRSTLQNVGRQNKGHWF